MTLTYRLSRSFSILAVAFFALLMSATLPISAYAYQECWVTGYTCSGNPDDPQDYECTTTEQCVDVDDSGNTSGGSTIYSCSNGASNCTGNCGPTYSESTYYNQSGYYGESQYYDQSSYAPGESAYYDQGTYGPGQSAYYGESDYYSESTYGGGGGGSPAATVSLTATPLSVVAGGTSRLTWTSSNATSCTGSGTGFNTGGATNNSIGIVVGPLTAPGPWPYQINCTGSGGSGSDSKTITINNGILYMLGTPSRVNSGAATNIAWSATALPASTVCTLTRNGSAWSAASPASRTASVAGVIATSSTNVSDTITSQTIYKLTCNGVVYQAIVNVNGQVQEF